MSTRSKGFALISVLIALSMLLGACGTTEVIKTVEVSKEVVQTVEVEKEVVQTVEVEKEVVKEVVVTPTAVASNRKGAWVDSVVFSEVNSADAAVTQLQAGEIDIYAYTVNNPELYKKVQEDPNLTYTNSFGSYNELTFNPVQNFADGRLNPFGNPKVREAMNWLIDRDYIVQEIYGGLASPRFFPVTGSFPDYTRYVDVARALEAKYAYNPDKAKEVITAEMEAMGAKLVDNKWQFNDQPLTIIIIIRTEDERRPIGDYVANQLETIGFTVDRQYKTRTEASPIWNQGNPPDGLFHIYTGGWITTAVSRDDATNFGYFYTNRGSGSPLWQAYTPSAEYDELCEKLWINDFKSMDERRELFSKALELALQDSVRLWLIDQKAFTPRRNNTMAASDLAGQIAGSALWPYTVRLTTQEGGVVRIAQPGILVEPWNPLSGSNWIYDTMVRRATEDAGVMADPYTGLVWPQRVEKAEVVVQEGLPVAKTLDWLDLKFEKEITIPDDAWVDWDAANQKFITASEKYTSTQTTLSKVTVTYPKDMFQTIKWHDGSPLTPADFVMSMIMTYDPGYTDSPIYDEALAPGVESFLSHFKGVRIVSTDPLVIESYDDQYFLDAEAMVRSWWPQYGFGTAPWYNMAVGYLADSNKELAFSTDKADANGVEWMSFISGPSLEILKANLDKATADNFIPYAATMGQYVTAEDAAARYASLAAWYEARNHFWLGTGPFYLYRVYPVEGTITVQRNVDYPDAANKWDRFGEPKIAVAEIDGPGQVTIGQEAKYDVFVTFKDEPYPQAEIVEVKYLVFNAKGELVTTGLATAVADGQYQITLSADITKGLEAGANKLEVAVSPLLVSLPTFASYEFVTAP